MFGGLGIGALWKSLSWIFNLFRTESRLLVRRAPASSPTRRCNVDISPEYLGVGYVIGPRIAGTMFAGGVLSWLVLLPLLSILGGYITDAVPADPPATSPTTRRPGSRS